MSRSVAHSVVVDAPPSDVFDLLADPAKHATFDGSGSVQGRLAGPPRLYLGASFGMRMRIKLPYVIRNTVVEFEEDRAIAWRHLGQHVWRYELEPLDAGSTRVTESWDWSHALPVPQLYELAGFPTRNLASIERTLRNLKELVESSPATVR